MKLRLTSNGGLVLAIGWGLLAFAYATVVWQQVRYGIEYDESTNLNLIDNFANGRGYATTGQTWLWYEPFNPGASTGPSVIFPSSFVWWLTDGNLAWTRLVPLGLFALLPTALAVLFGRIFGAWAALVAAASPLVLAVNLPDISTVSLVPGRFIGEFAGAAFIAALALALQRQRPFVAGLMGGLAVLSKFNFLFPVLIGLTTWWLVTWLRQSRPSMAQVMASLGGLALPLVLFEAFKFLQLGFSDYVDSTKAYIYYLINQGGDYPSAPLNERVPERLAGLTETMAPWTLLFVLTLLIATALLVGRTAPQGPSLLTVGPLILVTSGLSILLWWLLSSPQDSPRLGLPVILLITPVLLVAAFSAIFQRWSSGTDRVSRSWRLLTVVLVTAGFALIAYQGIAAAQNDFGARMMAEQEEAAEAIVQSGTPSLPYEFMGHLAHFQLLTGIPSVTKPDSPEPTIRVLDSIRARIFLGKDDARELVEECGPVLYSSQAALICRPLLETSP